MRAERRRRRRQAGRQLIHDACGWARKNKSRQWAPRPPFACGAANSHPLLSRPYVRLLLDWPLFAPLSFSRRVHRSSLLSFAATESERRWEEILFEFINPLWHKTIRRGYIKKKRKTEPDHFDMKKVKAEGRNKGEKLWLHLKQQFTDCSSDKYKDFDDNDCMSFLFLWTMF